MKKAAIVTLTVGSETHIYDKHFIPSIKAYANKWGFDFIQLKDLLEPVDIENIKGYHKKHTICVQKLLILEQPFAKEYEYIIFIDSDILVNFEKAPNILDGLEQGKIGVVPERSLFGVIPYDSSITDRMPTWPKSAEEYYKHYKFPKVFPVQINSGVMVYQPAYHTKFLKGVYDTYSQRIYAGEDIDGDQGPLNYELHTQNLFQYMDDSWNRIWLFYHIAFYGFLNSTYDKPALQQAMKSIFDKTYFLHLAGHVGWDLLE
jgi:hypothetical protein